MAPMEPLAKAIALCGGKAALARALHTYPQKVDNWTRRSGRVPLQYCVAIEQATAGVVTVEQLRPELIEQWRYLRGTAKAGEPHAEALPPEKGGPSTPDPEGEKRYTRGGHE